MKESLVGATTLHVILLIVVASATILLNQYVMALTQSNEKRTTMTKDGSTGSLITLTTNKAMITNKTLDGLNVTSVDTRLRITNTNGSAGHAGIVWTTQNATYYALLRPSNSVVSIFTPPKGEMLFAKVFPHLSKNTWYDLKVNFDPNGFNVALNNEVLFRVPQPYANLHVLNVGVKAYNSTAEFEPPKINIHYTYIK